MKLLHWSPGWKSQVWKMGPVIGVFRSPCPCRQAGSLDGSSLFFGNKNRGLRVAYRIQVTSETAAACHQPRGTDKQQGHVQVSDTSHFRGNEHLYQQSMMSWQKLWSYHLAFQLRQNTRVCKCSICVKWSLYDFHILSFTTCFYWQTLSQKEITELFSYYQDMCYYQGISIKWILCNVVLGHCSDCLGMGK